jgi:cholesterol transport system auxiliary component
MSQSVLMRMLLPVALLMLAACSGFRSRDAVVQTYVLRGALVTPVSAAPLAPMTERIPTLAVSRPTAASGLDSENIAAIRADGRFDYYNASRWAGNLPDIMQTLLIESLRSSGRYRAVLADTSAFSADRLLQIEIRQFQSEYGSGAAPTIHLVLEGTLGNRAQREIMSVVRAESSVPASADRMSAVVAAFNTAVSDALRQLNAAL